MSLIYFKINSENIVTEAVYFEPDDYPDEKYWTNIFEETLPLAEEDYDTVPIDTWIDTDTVLLEQRKSPVIDNINRCLYNRSSKTFSEV